MAWFVGNPYGSAPLWQTSPEDQLARDTRYYEGLKNTPQYQDQLTAYNEGRTRYQAVEDREYQARMQQISQQADQIAISKGQAEANAWAQREQTKLAREQLGLNRQQFETQATGYYNGAPTMAREQFQDDSLFKWTGKAIDLGSTPADWVKLLRLQSGVSNNLSSIPGLNWASGGQQGNQSMQGTPQTSSLSQVMGGLGVGGGNWAASAAQSVAGADATPGMTPDQQSIYQAGREFAANPAGAAPGWLEGLDPLTKDLLRGSWEAQGFYTPSVESKYKTSRYMGGSGAGMA